MRIKVALHFNGRGYIADPFWPEMSQLIQIEKKSGFNRLKNEDKRRKSLMAYLEKIGMTEADYAALKAQVARRFHTDGNGRIVIPEDKFLAFLRSTVHEAPSSVRAIDKDQINNSIMLVGGFLWTEKTEANGIFSRFVKGQDSNERRRQEDAYISDFTARGEMEVDESSVNPEALRKMLEWGGKYKGIGAARPMGYGRFAVVEFAVV